MEATHQSCVCGPDTNVNAFKLGETRWCMHGEAELHFPPYTNYTDQTSVMAVFCIEVVYEKLATAVNKFC